MSDAERKDMMEYQKPVAHRRQLSPTYGRATSNATYLTGNQVGEWNPHTYAQSSLPRFNHARMVACATEDGGYIIFSPSQGSIQYEGRFCEIGRHQAILTHSVLALHITMTVHWTA
jgi:hypothetical protein